MKQATDIGVDVGRLFRVTVKGFKFGEHLAVTPAPRDYGPGNVKFMRGEWSVTHIPTSRRLGPVMPKKSAMTFARLLSEKDVWDFYATVKREVPRRVRVHFMKCIKELDIKDNGK